ncbi:MAG TPA: nucleotide exchange factor GrpE [Candidatus Saccharibacteria bacterium]|nr:nucleotide exchange factor GrpE [Candidatus Saccharibacteria bacterium]HMT55441.1 nucleotide exchange factor GrpE [Candidatus Saccharibacteria bacterium]
MTKKKQEDEDIRLVAEQLAQENAQLNEALLRERADAMNVRKRADEERTKLAGFYKAHVVKELLPVIDNFERALKHLPTELEGNEYIKGIQGIVKQFEQTLSKIGVTRIKTVGEHFDPMVHEAVTMEEGDGEHEIVSEELQSGYMLGDEVVRHAMVRVKAQ